MWHRSASVPTADHPLLWHQYLNRSTQMCCRYGKSMKYVHRYVHVRSSRYRCSNGFPTSQGMVQYVSLSGWVTSTCGQIIRMWRTTKYNIKCRGGVVANMGWRGRGGPQLWGRGMLMIFNYGMDGWICGLQLWDREMLMIFNYGMDGYVVWRVHSWDGESIISEKNKTFIEVEIVHSSQEHLELSRFTKIAHVRLLYLA